MGNISIIKLPSVLIVLLSFTFSGCATYKTIENAKIGSPKVFSGTRLNLYAIHKNEIALKKFNVSAPKYPVVDLPFSFFADLMISPLTGGMAAYEVITDAK